MSTDKIDVLAEVAYLRGRLKKLNHGSLVMTVDRIGPAVAELIEALREMYECADTPSTGRFDNNASDFLKADARCRAALAKVQP